MAEETNRSGGVDFNADKINIDGDVVGRDKIIAGGDYIGRDQIITNIGTFVERALTAAEEARQAQSIEAEYLAQGVSAFAQRLRDRISDTNDADKGGPYKGLLEYRLSDAEIFFGRDRAIRELLEHLLRGPLTVLHAESGAGKTSLIQAGVSPRLITAGHLPVYLRPYNVAPPLALKRAFLSNLTAAPKLAQASLRDFVSQVAGVLGSSGTLYICLDQFEEFFTQLEEQARSEFIRELAECLDDESLNARWVLALRSEFFGNLATFRPRIRNPYENDYRLNRLTRAEARKAVAQPAARRGITYEDGLIDTILDDLGKDEVAPPQVQLVCSTLYESGSLDQNVIKHGQYTSEGGAAGILRGHLGRVLNRDLLAEQRPIAQRLLEELITSEVRRVIRTHTELANRLVVQGVQSKTLDVVLSQLVDSRLLRVEDVGGEPSYELAHDYLLDEINLDPAVQARKAAQELLEQEVRAYRRHGTILSDDKFAIIAARRGELALADDAKALILKSERALKRRQRLVFGGIGLVIVLFIVGALSVLAAIGAQSVADQAQMQQATSEAGAAAASIREAIANESAATATAREATANQALRIAFERSGIVPVGEEPIALTFDGERLWVAYRDESIVQAIDPATGNVGASITVGDPPSALAFDGERLWVANYEHDSIQAIDPASGDVGELITGYFGGPVALVFEDTRLWVAGGSWRVHVVDLTTGDPGESFMVDEFPSSLAFDGARVWVANRGSGTQIGSVQTIDPATGDLGTPIEVGSYLSALAYDGRRLWVADSDDGTVQAIDPATGNMSAPIPVGTSPSALAYDGRRLWVANTGDDTVQVIDPALGDVGAPIRVSDPTALAFGGAHLWVANYEDGTVQAIDPARGLADEPIAVGVNPIALTYVGARLWVANSGDGTVQTINPVTGEVSAPIRVGDGPSALAYGGGRLWVANRFDGTVQAIDPETGSVDEPIRVGRVADALVYDGTRLWVANKSDGTVQPIDLAIGSVGTPITVGIAANIDPSALAYGGGRVWVAKNSDSTVQAIDPETGKVGPPSRVLADPSALAFDGMQLWVANRFDGTVQTIDPVTGEVSAPIRVGDGPGALAYGSGRLWVANKWGGTVQYILLYNHGNE